ncbi:MAG: cytochrome c biogenesis CcdA family protein [Anaerolineae bacterium]
MANLVLLPVVLGIVGSFTPCALGINAVFLGYVMGKPRPTRLWEWLLFALARAAFLMLLGLLFGLLGQYVGAFVRGYQKLIAVGLIVLGALFIVSRYRPLPLPHFSLMGDRNPGTGSTLALGAVLGLDIPACTSPLVLALLAQTVLVGNFLFGAISLFLFGIGMSLPLLAILYEGANRWLIDLSRRYKTAFYLAAGGLLMVVGVAELSPRVMAVVGGWLNFVLRPFLGI